MKRRNGLRVAPTEKTGVQWYEIAENEDIASEGRLPMFGTSYTSYYVRDMRKGVRGKNIVPRKGARRNVDDGEKEALEDGPC